MVESRNMFSASKNQVPEGSTTYWRMDHDFYEECLSKFGKDASNIATSEGSKNCNLPSAPRQMRARF